MARIRRWKAMQIGKALEELALYHPLFGRESNGSTFTTGRHRIETGKSPAP